MNSRADSLLQIHIFSLLYQGEFFPPKVGVRCFNEGCEVFGILFFPQPTTTWAPNPKFI